MPPVTHRIPSRSGMPVVLLVPGRNWAVVDGAGDIRVHRRAPVRRGRGYMQLKGRRQPAVILGASDVRNGCWGIVFDYE